MKNMCIKYSCILPLNVLCVKCWLWILGIYDHRIFKKYLTIYYWFLRYCHKNLLKMFWKYSLQMENTLWITWWWWLICPNVFGKVNWCGLSFSFIGWKDHVLRMGHAVTWVRIHLSSQWVSKDVLFEFINVWVGIKYYSLIGQNVGCHTTKACRVATFRLRNYGPLGKKYEIIQNKYGTNLKWPKMKVTNDYPHNLIPTIILIFWRRSPLYKLHLIFFPVVIHYMTTMNTKSVLT